MQLCAGRRSSGENTANQLVERLGIPEKLGHVNQQVTAQRQDLHRIRMKQGKRLRRLAITHISIVNSVNLYLIRIPIL
jgi:hypothetical protein